ncbi:hypothetical protein [Paenarthrobacter histidinolovorans]|uniref:Uncharacterized protein n=1 Tax=Paenarthrobacter histidinolovorans TaxID=43664 RepID=A0ABW8MZJ1_9MICC
MNTPTRPIPFLPSWTAARTSTHAKLRIFKALEPFLKAAVRVFALLGVGVFALFLALMVFATVIAAAKNHGLDPTAADALMQGINDVLDGLQPCALQICSALVLTIAAYSLVRWAQKAQTLGPTAANPGPTPSPGDNTPAKPHPSDLDDAVSVNPFNVKDPRP